MNRRIFDIFYQYYYITIIITIFKNCSKRLCNLKNLNIRLQNVLKFIQILFKIFLYD